METLRKHSALFLFLLCFISSGLFAQGEWNPPGADLSYPRTLLDSSEIDDVRAVLTDSLNLELYTGITGNAFIWPYTANSSVGDTRVRSQIAKNAAFVVLMNAKYNASTQQLDTLTATQRNDLIDHAIHFMENINHSMQTWPSYGDWQYRANELNNYVIAYDLLRGAGVPAGQLNAGANKIQEFAGHFYDEITSVPLIGFLNVVKNNHTTRVLGSMATAAIVLNHKGANNPDAHPINWINMAAWNLDNVLWRDADPVTQSGGIFGYGEGPYYMKYGLNHFMVYAHAMGNFLPDGNYNYTWRPQFSNETVSIRNPWYDDRYDLLWEWYARIRLPDGRMPPLDDSYINDAYPAMAIMEKPEFNPPLAFNKIVPGQANTLRQFLMTGSDDMRADYICSRTGFVPETRAKFQPLPDAGSLVFRSSWEPDANYLHVLGEHGVALDGGSGHNQADVTSFILMSKGEMLALDPGYIKWGKRDSVGHFDDHSMITVDNEGPSTGTIGNAQGAPGFIEHFYDLPEMDYGEVRTAYKGADIVRKILSPRDEYYILTDFITSASSHDYQFQLHGHGRAGGDSIAGQFYPDYANFSAQWRRGDVRLTAQVLARGTADVYQSTVDVHEFKYDVDSTHNTLRVNRNGVNNTEFVTTLIPHQADSFNLVPFHYPDWTGFRLEKSGWTDFYAAGEGIDTLQLSPAQTGLPAPISFVAAQVFISLDANGKWKQYYVEDCAWLAYDNIPLVIPPPGLTATVGLYRDTDDHYLGYNEEVDGFLTLGLPYGANYTLFAGQGCVSYTDWLPTNELRMRICPDSYFEIADTPLVLSRYPEVPNLQIWPNPAGEAIWYEAPQDVQTGQVIDLQGRVVKSTKLGVAKGIIDLKGLPEGIYLLRLQMRDGTFGTRRILKKE